MTQLPLALPPKCQRLYPIEDYNWVNQKSESCGYKPDEAIHLIYMRFVMDVKEPIEQCHAHLYKMTLSELTIETFGVGLKRGPCQLKTPTFKGKGAAWARKLWDQVSEVFSGDEQEYTYYRYFLPQTFPKAYQVYATLFLEALPHLFQDTPIHGTKRRDEERWWSEPRGKKVSAWHRSSTMHHMKQIRRLCLAMKEDVKERPFYNETWEYHFTYLVYQLELCIFA